MQGQVKLAKSLRRYGGDQRIMERERQIESYLTQDGLTDEERRQLKQVEKDFELTQIEFEDAATNKA